MKPKPKKTAAAKPAPSNRGGFKINRPPHRRVLIRMPLDLALWMDDTSANLGISRDALCRQLLVAARDGFKAAEIAGSDESVLFRDMENRLLAALEKAAERVVRDALKVSLSGRVSAAATK
jgi:hypothetical protein